eukprot:66285-Alexandrium_andersonii.AAC.1
MSIFSVPLWATPCDLQAVRAASALHTCRVANAWFPLPSGLAMLRGGGGLGDAPPWLIAAGRPMECLP